MFSFYFPRKEDIVTSFSLICFHASFYFFLLPKYSCICIFIFSKFLPSFIFSFLLTPSLPSHSTLLLQFLTPSYSFSAPSFPLRFTPFLSLHSSLSVSLLPTPLYSLLTSASSLLSLLSPLPLPSFPPVLHFHCSSGRASHRLCGLPLAGSINHVTEVINQSVF